MSPTPRYDEPQPPQSSTLFPDGATPIKLLNSGFGIFRRKYFYGKGDKNLFSDEKVVTAAEEGNESGFNQAYH